MGVTVGPQRRRLLEINSRYAAGVPESLYAAPTTPAAVGLPPVTGGAAQASTAATTATIAASTAAATAAATSTASTAASSASAHAAIATSGHSRMAPTAEEISALPKLKLLRP